MSKRRTTSARPRRGTLGSWRSALVTALLLSGCGAADRSRGDDAVGSATTPALPITPTQSAERVASSRPTAGERASGPACPLADTRAAGYPPWHRGYPVLPCVRTGDGRWLAEKDPTDVDGWRHFLVLDGPRGRALRVPVVAPVAMAARVDGSVVVLDLKDGVTLVGRDGAVSWTSSHPKCGAVDGVAIDEAGAITFTCGYSVLRLEPDGKLAWQKWPFGNQGVRGPWVDRDGAVYVSGGGAIAALETDGSIRWRLGTGDNRAIGEMAFNEAGNLVFDTSMAARHSDSDSPGGLILDYEHEPNELFEITRSGVVVTRAPHENGPPSGGWPATLPIPEDGAHRAP